MTKHTKSVARRAASIVSLVGATMLMAAGTAAAATNPLEGITPDMGILGPAFNNTWTRIAAAVWGVLIAGSSIKLLTAIYKMRASRAGGYSSEMTDAAQEAKVAGIAFGALAGAGAIIAAILFVVQG
ncbi:hypothetical protein ACFYVR_25045 [Rhodococcus sp. NPDC003318]|uniref:hypothetical protein n=1 Tax=Rhodococcus sp. NPDC003318 TaxID=3364503 RepID=UPI0036C022F0